MAEKDFWRDLEKEFRLPGKIQRNEVKSRAGFPDVLGCILGKFIVLELKEVKGSYNTHKHKSFPYGLTGPQAVQLKKWSCAEGIAYLAVRFTDDNMVYMFEGQRLINFVSMKDLVKKDLVKKHQAPLPLPDYILPVDKVWPVLYSIR